MKKLILFDIDGTILKFKEYYSSQIFTNMIKEMFGKEVPDTYVPDYAGRTDLSILEDLAKACEIEYSSMTDQVDEIWDYLYEGFQEHNSAENMHIMPGVVELIEDLSEDSGYDLGLLTGNFEKNAYLKLRSCDLEQYFEFGAFGSDHKDRNKLADIAISRANAVLTESYSSDSTIIIGDSPRDIECAKSNGIGVLAVATGGYSYDDLMGHDADVVMHDLSDLGASKQNIERITQKNKS